MILRTLVKPLVCVIYQVIHVDYTVAVVIFAYRAFRLRDNVVVFRFTIQVFFLWSGAARDSRWVRTEIVSAYHLGKFIVPCVVSDAPLPEYLRSGAAIA